jgi:chemotaxis protein methyltransferase CheR
VQPPLELGFGDPDSCIERFLTSSFTKPQLEVLASHLTVVETYFFRERKSFEALAEHVLPDHVKAGQRNAKRLRIWSAGCATGEEPYSLAILVRQLIPNLSEWNITILASASTLASCAGRKRRSTRHGPSAIVPQRSRSGTFSESAGVG